MTANTVAMMARLIWDAPHRVLRPQGLAQAWRLPGAGSRDAGPVCRRSGRRATPLRFGNYNAGRVKLFLAGAAWLCAASGLWAAGKLVQRSWIGLLGAGGELSELAAHHQQHRDDRDDRDPAQDPVDRARRPLQPAPRQVGHGRVDPGPDDAAGGVS